MIRRVLIANRGEIAVRIIRTCRKLGIGTVAVFSDTDRAALHVREADEAVPIGPAPAAQSYLRIEAIVEAARQSGADALHPGYGFLSENPALAEACHAAGIVFIGPPAEAMRLLGDKAAARRMAASLGIPVVPGYDGEDQRSEVLIEASRSIGFPVMIKAAAGGGGRGMRLVPRVGEFRSAVESAQREATAAFGDGRLLIERALLRPRHVEIQIIADSEGSVVTLGERECSIQRRHQKIVEESPSPAVDAEVRSKLSEAAAKIARAAGYVGAGTVEFLMDADGACYFLEVNARLQVEHPVTEMVAGIDLVADQIRVAAGLPLLYKQEDVALHGHAVECRLVAEDPRHDYQPSSGRIMAVDLPHQEDIRIDSGVAAGDEIPSYYDPMMAKVIAWGPTRLDAMERMQHALDTAYVGGIQTNLPLLRAVVASPTFRQGDLSTDFLRTAVNPAELQPLPPAPILLAAFGVEVLGLQPAHRDPWHAAGPWRIGGEAQVELLFDGNQVSMIGRREPAAPDRWTVQIAEARHPVGIQRLGPDSMVLEHDGRRTVFRVQGLIGPGPESRGRERSSGFLLTNGGRSYRFHRPIPTFTAPKTAPHQERGLRAPMHGTVVKVFVEPGQVVEAHQPLVALEAMKMEHTIDSLTEGTVTQLLCQIGQQVKEGDLLVEIDGK